MTLGPEEHSIPVKTVGPMKGELSSITANSFIHGERDKNVGQKDLGHVHEVQSMCFNIPKEHTMVQCDAHRKRSNNVWRSVCSVKQSVKAKVSCGAHLKFCYKGAWAMSRKSGCCLGSRQAENPGQHLRFVGTLEACHKLGLESVLFLGGLCPECNCSPEATQLARQDWYSYFLIVCNESSGCLLGFYEQCHNRVVRITLVRLHTIPVYSRVGYVVTRGCHFRL